MVILQSNFTAIKFIAIKFQEKLANIFAHFCKRK